VYRGTISLILVPRLHDRSVRLPSGSMVRCASTTTSIVALGLEWMRHKEIEFTVEPTAERDDVWVWRFTIGGEVRAGKTVAKLKLLAIRRVQSVIDRELRKRDGLSQRR
jgi:hypothetical protein